MYTLCAQIPAFSCFSTPDPAPSRLSTKRLMREHEKTCGPKIKNQLLKAQITTEKREEHLLDLFDTNHFNMNKISYINTGLPNIQTLEDKCVLLVYLCGPNEHVSQLHHSFTVFSTEAAQFPPIFCVLLV